MGYGVFLKLLRRYWLHLAAVSLLGLLAWRAYAWAYSAGERDERALWLAKENKALTAAVAERDRAIADRNEAQRKADRLAKLPAKVIERVRTNPSRCVLPAPVADGLREQGDEIDAAIREVQ